MRRQLAPCALALLLVAAAVVFGGAAPAPTPQAPAKPTLSIPPDSPRWELEGQARVAEFLGRKCLLLDGGAASVKEFAMRDGVIDVDVATPAKRGFFGIQFRVSDDGAGGEWVYLRQHKSGLPDAIQYTPVLHTGLNWQIYNGPGFTGPVDIPRDAWFHLRLAVTGAQARLYFNDLEKPVLVMDDLKSGLQRGQVALAVLTGETYFSNFEVRPTPDALWQRHEPPMRTDLVNGLKPANADVPGRKRLWGRNALVVAQIAISLMLLTASFLMVRGFQGSLSDGVGFAKQRVLMVRFDPRLLQYDAARTREFYRLLIERVRETPGVEAAALTQSPPLGLGDFESITFVPDGYETTRDRESFASAMDAVDEGFFETLGIAILKGRGFSATDTAESPRVAVVNQQLANRYWPGADAVGRRLRLDGRTGTPVEIVGVAQTIKYRGPTEMPTDFVYVPQAQHPAARMVLLARSRGDARELVGSVKDIVRSLDPNLPMLATRTYEDLYRYHAVEGPRVAIELVGALGVAGLLLAVAGLYGLVAYNVARRTREIGIRMAIGARPWDVLRLMIGKGLVLVGIGASIGLAMGVAVERVMNSALFNAGGVDLLVYLVVVPAMLLVTMLAAYIPARRASRIAPTVALRCE